MAMKGRTEGWISIGFEPLEWMKDADMIMGTVEGEGDRPGPLFNWTIRPP